MSEPTRPLRPARDESRDLGHSRNVVIWSLIGWSSLVAAASLSIATQAAWPFALVAPAAIASEILASTERRSAMLGNSTVISVKAFDAAATSFPRSRKPLMRMLRVLVVLAAVLVPTAVALLVASS